MFKRIWLPVLCAAILVHVSPALANNSDENTGNQLVRECHIAVRVMNGSVPKSPKLAFLSVPCVNFVSGVMDGLVMAGVLGRGRIICPPKNSNYGQAVRVVTKWLDEHPAQLNDSQGILTAIALHNAWPCKPRE